jgi:hypothetical protein
VFEAHGISRGQERMIDPDDPDEELENDEFDDETEE